MKLLLSTTVLLWCTVLSALAENDDTYTNYLSRSGLKADDCVSNAPNVLFPIIRDREKLGYGGTPGHEASSVDTFYQKYLETLRPYNDSHFADVSNARQPLRELFYYVTDAFEDVTRDRTYITHERIDSFVEHLIVCLAESGMPVKATDLDLSADDAAAYLRARFVLIHDAAVAPPDFDAFRGQVASKLRRICKTNGAIDSRTLHYYAVTFADNYRTPLNPLVGAPE